MANFKIEDRRFSFQAAEKQEFDSAFKQRVRDGDTTETPIQIDPKVAHSGKSYSDFLSALGWHLEGLWNEVRGYRTYIEERWLNDLRQYRGEYEPEIRSRIHPKRSKAFIRLTRTKVKTVDARCGDILFPAGREKNWGIEPTPVPEFPPEMIEQLTKAVELQTKSAGGDPKSITPDTIKEIIREDAKIRSRAMEQEIEDQLTEIKYRDTIRKVLHSGNLYGTGILKGPLVKKKVYKRWQADPGNPGQWKVERNEKIVPYCEFVSIWDIYPEMSAVDFENCSYVFQRHTMSRNKVLELADRSDFNGMAIRQYLNEHKDGDATYENFENVLRNINSDNKSGKVSRTEGQPIGSGIVRLHKKYNLKEFWGFLSADQLKDQGVELDSEISDLQEVAANIWMLGPLIIKAVLSPIEGIDLPYHFFYFDKDETSIFGEGIPSIMRDPQELSNAAIRALLDNAAISAGPIIEANIDLLADGEDPLDIYPFRVFQRTGVGAEAGAKAITIQNQKAYTGEFLQMLQTFMTMGDEVTTIPRYMWGESGGAQGAGRTATGLSMLMGSVNITLKDQIKNFDDGITKPYIRAHYFWNMEFNPKPEIKGDFNVVAKGTGSLMAKEVKLETLVKYLQVISSFPELIQSLDLKKLNDDLTNILELDSFTKSDTQLQSEAEQKSEANQKQEEFVKTLELTKAVSGGHIDTEALQMIIGGLKGERASGI